MNKETRTFVWGLLLVFICGLSVCIHIDELYDGKVYSWYNWVLMGLNVCGFLSGVQYVGRSID